MHILYYWQGVIANEEIFAKYFNTIEKLLSGQYKSADLDLKKLPGFKIYTIRVNRRDRLVFTTRKHQGKSYLELIDVIENHEYSKSRCFQPALLKYLLERGEEQANTNITEQSFESMSESLEINTGPTNQGIRLVPLEYYNGLHIELDEIQNNAKNVKLPALISGNAGSGKSCVALAVLAQAVAKGVTLDKKIGYLTESRFLLEHMQKIWLEHPLSQNLSPGQVEFVNFETLMRAQCANLADLESVDESFFAEWFIKYLKKNHSNIKLKHSVSLIYQELCILSAFTEAEYLKLGKRQSLITEESLRSWLMEMKQCYQDFLHQNKKVDFHLFTHQDFATQYGLIVVDEGQDYTALQLEQLAYLSGFQLLICQDTLQSVYEIKAHSTRFEQKLYTQNIKLSRAELKGTYRCPIKVVEVANHWLQLKHLLLGGTSEKHEIGVITPQNGAAQGTVRWYEDQPCAEEFAVLQNLAKTTHFAVVTTSKRIIEAQELFGTPLVFTSAQIKGLDYETVVLYQLLDDPSLVEANKQLQKKFPQGINFFSNCQNRAKKTTDNEPLVTAFNQIFTAATRMTQQLVVWQRITHEINILAKTWQRIFTQGHEDKLLSVEATPTDWRLEAERQQRMGNEHIADAILREKFKPAEAEEKPTTGTEKPENKEINLNNKPILFLSEKKLRACLKKPEGMKELFAVTLGGCTILQVFKNPKLQKILSSSLINYNLQQLFINEILKNTLNDKPLILELGKLDGFVQFIRDEEFSPLITLESLGKEYFDQQGKKTSCFKEMANTSAGCELLSIFLESAGFLGTNVTYQKIIAEESEDYPILVSLILNRRAPRNFIKELIHKIPSFLQKMQFGDLIKIHQEPLSKMAHTSFLYWFASNDKDALFSLLQSYPHLVQSQRALEFLSTLFYENKARRSPFYHLFMEAQETFDENSWNDYGFGRLLDIPENELASFLSMQNSWTEKYTLNYTHFYQLAQTSSGCGFFLYLIKLKPELVAFLKAEDLMQMQFIHGYEDTVCSALARCAPGRTILNKLIQINPKLFQNLTSDWLRQGLVNENVINNLFHLSNDNQGLSFLFNLMQMNPELQNIEFMYLVCPYSNQREGYLDSTALYNLSKTPTGHKILNLLIKKEPFIEKIKMDKLTITSYSGDHCLHHPLYVLVQYHSFMQLEYPIWVQLIDFRSDLKSDIMSKYILDYYGPIKNCFLFCAMTESKIGKERLYDYWQEGHHFREFLKDYQHKLQYEKIKAYTEERMKVPGKIIFDFILNRKLSIIKDYPLHKLIELIGFSKNPFMYYLTHPDYFREQFKAILDQYPLATYFITVDDLLEKNNLILAQILNNPDGATLLYKMIKIKPSLGACLKKIPDSSEIWSQLKNPEGRKIFELCDNILSRKKALLHESLFKPDSQISIAPSDLYISSSSEEIPWRQ